MKPLLLAAALLLTQPAMAAALDPDEYAKVYCRIMEQGGSRRDALALATVSATRKNLRSYTITYKGKSYKSDALRSAMAIADRCPGYL